MAELVYRGKAYESKWVYLNLDKILTHYRLEKIEEIVLRLDPYWLEQLAISAYNKADVLEIFPGEYIEYEDGRITWEDVITFIKRFLPLLVAQELIGIS